MKKSKPIKLYQNKDWLYQKYIEEKLDTIQIGKLANCHGTSVCNWLKNYNIPIRSWSECTKLYWKNTPHPKGKDWHTWKGGKYKNQQGYICIYKPEHPNAQSAGYLFEHRLIMEKHIGRHLHPWEIVHHINGIRGDNGIENLELLPNRGVHNNKVQEVYKENVRLKLLLISLLSASRKK